MLTNLNFLRPGQQWPPASEQTRMERYAQNRRLWEGQHSGVYESQLRRVQRTIGNFEDVIGYNVVINYQRLISLKTADLLVGEPPEISGRDDAQTEALRQTLTAHNLQRTLYQAAIDLSRYGDALLALHKDDRGEVTLSAGQPAIWFPVLSPVDVKTVLHHVVAWEVKDERDRPVELHVQVHSRGSYTYTVYNYSPGRIGEVKQDAQTVQTGYDGFAVIPLTGVSTSDGVYGYDDYMPIDSLVSEVMVVVANISRILDKHAAPSMQGPEDALEPDGQGGYKFRPGNYFTRRDKEDPGVAYITWDGQLGAAFQQLKNLLEQLYVISEMGEALLGTNTHQGVTTYKGLKLRMTSALAKVARIAANITAPLKEALSALLGVPAADLTIRWHDGIPDDAAEAAELIQLQNGGKPTMSHLHSIRLANGYDETRAEAELAAILDEEAQALPTAPAIVRDGVGDEELDNEAAT
jgi:hypothetical protein